MAVDAFLGLNHCPLRQIWVFHVLLSHSLLSMKHSLERILTVRYKYSQFVGQVFSKLPVDKGSTPCKTM